MVQNQIRSLFLLFAGEEELPDAVQPCLLYTSDAADE